jgi:Ca2+-transporting ATPase
LSKPFWHTLTVEAACSQLNVTTGGLTTAEAARRLAQYGPNELRAAKRVSAWALLIEQFKNVLIVILLIATALSAFLGHGIEATATAIIVLFAALLGFVEEYRAERAIEALRKMAAPTTTAVRDEIEVEIPTRELVVGDLILLHSGDRVPADARLVEAVNLKVEEAALTGESEALSKDTSALPKMDLPLGDRKNMVYAGTTATYGRGQAIVVATAMDTEFGKIATMLETVEAPKTHLQQNLDRLGTILARIALAVVGVIVIAGMARKQPFIEMFIFGIALAVAVVPEALPAVVTISMALGVQRMARRNALMRRLAAVETLGSTSVICSDKTGTLTKDEMTVRRLFVESCFVEVSGSGYTPEGEFRRDGKPTTPSDALKDLLKAAVLASDAHIVQEETDGRWDVKGDPTEGALVVAAAKAGLHKRDLDERFPRIAEIPFTSETKRMTTSHKTSDGAVAFSKGAPEVIIASCILGEADRHAIMAAAAAMAGDALRVLAIARKYDGTLETAEREMTFLGLIGMIDPPRVEAKAAVEKCESAGIKPVMITGDHPLTARAVARELGILKAGRVVTGSELEAMTDENLEGSVNDIEVYARVSPAHKLRVVTALQKNRHVVAMTGDGANDAPALKKSDIGIAMGITGTDVSKEAAAMTLTDDNFSSIVAAVEEGRHIFGNIKKYLMYLLSSNLGEIGLIAAATFVGLPLPLSAVQILYINLATDGLPALALAVDPPESDLMRRKPVDPQHGIFTRAVVVLVLIGGVWSAAVNFALYRWTLTSGRSQSEAMTMTFVALVLTEFFKAYNFRSDRRSLFDRPFANKWLNLAILWELVLLLVVVYVPWAQRLLGTFSLTTTDWILALTAAVSICPVLEIAKRLIRPSL